MRRQIGSAAIFIVVLFLFFVFPPRGEASIYDSLRILTGTANKVFDGDTIQVLTPEHRIVKVRLYGIDAPEVAVVNTRTGKVSEPGQPFGNESRSYLSSLILNKPVRLSVIYTDRYKRVVSIVWCNDKNINLAMIEAGMAEPYKVYLEVQPYWGEFIHADIEATKKKIGIWSQRSYERPSVFRKRMNVKGSR